MNNQNRRSWGLLIRGRIAAVEGGDGSEGSREREDQETWTGKYWLGNDGEEKV